MLPHLLVLGKRRRVESMKGSSLGTDEIVDTMERDCISACICTLKRPELLGRLLNSLAGQVRTPMFYFEIVVVDNDKDRSAEETVRNFKLRKEVETIYDCEPEQNISLARNRAIRNARGNLIAFLDDDEYPGNDWLIQLYQVLNRYKADGVLGPVLPEFPPGAPEWLRQGDFFDRRRLATGSIISQQDTRTGNVLFRRTLFHDGELWFDHAYGRTGGEDSDFFRRQSKLGRVFVWCDEAVVHETVPPGRWRLSFYLKKSLRIGTLTGELVRRGELPSRWMLARNLLILSMSALLAPLMFVTRKHVQARIFVKMAYCAGYLFGFCGLGWLKQKE